jgi:hypothetical protein
VASEPCIFWTGDKDEAERIIAGIPIPKEAGYLKPADEKLNGSSGRTLDERYLSPLGYSRNDAWLCDLVPYSCQNAAQTRAIARAYEKATCRLPDVTIPPVPAILADQNRRDEILQELAESQATTIILLGDNPIKWFLSHVSDCKKKRLADFGKDTYGTAIKATIMDKEYSVLPLVHPRQAAGLGPNSKEWQGIHSDWLRKLTEK